MQIIRDILRHYDIGSVNRIDFIKAGQENTNYRIATDNQNYVLRVYNQSHSLRGERSREQIVLELEFMQRSRASGVIVPDVIVTNDNLRFIDACVDGDSHFVALFTFLEGQSLNQHSEKASSQIGELVNAIYPVGASFADLDMSMQYDIVSRCELAYQALADRGIAIPQAIIALWERIQAEKETISLATLSKGLVHGDIKLANLLFDDVQQLSAVLDFDDFRYSYLLEDATMALCHHWHAVDENLLRSGYYEVFIAQLTHSDLQRELVYLPFFLRVCLLRDIANYLRSGIDSLVDELLHDMQIQRYVLSP